MPVKIRPPCRIAKAIGNSKLILQNLDGFISENQDEPIRLLCGFWEDQADAISYQEIRQMVVGGFIDANVIETWMHDYSYFINERFASLLISAMAAGAKGQPIANMVFSRSETFRFDTALPGAADWIDTHGAQFVTRSTEAQKLAIKALVAKKVTEHHTVDELSRLIRPCIGLTAQQAAATVRFYDSIVNNLREKHPRMKAENVRKKALAAASRYAERAHRQRAMNIAQTELATAYNQGADQFVRQAHDMGLLGRVTKRWITSGDENVCDICISMNGTEIDIDGLFNTGRGAFATAQMLPPAHPRCACGIEYVEVR